MLLQISNGDTLDSLSLSNGQAANLTVYSIVGILTCALILFLLIRKKSVKSKTDSPNQTIISTSTEISTQPTKTNIPQTEIKQEKEVKDGIGKPIQVENTLEKKTEEKIPVAVFPKPQIVKAEKEEQSKEKYIGYNPINIFAQTEPLSFPYVIMPKPNCVIKFPRKGRVGRKGYKEEDFKIYIDKYFKTTFQVFDDRFILVKNNPKPFEPDFTLIDERNDINIFLDIEIDEPYEGLNDISKRKATHFQYSDTNRNNAFKNRGWIVIRFAEIQVHQEPNSCCRFIADVVRSINPKFVIPQALSNSTPIQPIKQWTKEEAEVWSREKYREKYLNVRRFGITSENQILDGVEETALGEITEEKVVDEKPFIPPVNQKFANHKFDLINSALQSNKYLSFTYQGALTVVKPIKLTQETLTAFCYVKNAERTFNLYEMSKLLSKPKYYTERIDRGSEGLERITNAVKTSIRYNKHIRMKYTRGAWTDIETGEFKDSQESLRTISNIGIANEVLEEEHINRYNLQSDLHINAFCNRDDVRKTFRFDRIGEIEILDI